MKLQLALDHTSLRDALTLLEKTADMVDIAEAGTPLILSEGIRVVREIRERFPGLAVLADLKIMDAGALEAGIGFDAGAHIVTVLAVCQEVTLRRAAEAARAHGGQLMADLIAAPDICVRARRVAELGADILCCHTAFDAQGEAEGPLAELEALRAALPDAALAVAGGITARRVTALLPFRPGIVIVGGAVSGAGDPRAALREIRGLLEAGR
jgi:3-hexulose-6-phosphate synthase